MTQNGNGNANKLAKLRKDGEGCAISHIDDAGKRHAAAYTHDMLPFNLPRVNIHAGKKGNGKPMSTAFREADGYQTRVECWVPDTLTPLQFMRVLARSRAQDGIFWSQQEERLKKAPILLRASDRAPLSDEGLTFASELADSVLGQRIRKPGAKPAVSSFRNLPETVKLIAKGGLPSSHKYECVTTDAYCECYSTWIGIVDPEDFTFYLIDVEWCMSTDPSSEPSVTVTEGTFPYPTDDYYGGGTFEIDGDDFNWLINNGGYGSPSYVCSGTTTPDGRDSLRQQYVNPAYGPAPYSNLFCSDFQYHPGSTELPWTKVKSQGPSPSFEWALFISSLSSGFAAIHSDTGFTLSNVVTGTYRSPQHNHDDVGSVAGSQHIYGAAVDVGSVSDSVHWRKLNRWAAGRSPAVCAEPWSVIKLGAYHVHFDWRLASDSYYKDACSTAWTPDPNP